MPSGNSPDLIRPTHPHPTHSIQRTARNWLDVLTDLCKRTMTGIRATFHCVPVVTRELRAESRNPFNYWSRVISAGVIVLLFGMIVMDARGSTVQIGVRLFHILSIGLFLSIMALVPVLAADCISRENREGTLGLLFLTPLRSHDIVIGKSVIYSLRATTLVLAAMPIMILPLTLGGVSTRQMLWAIDLNLSGLFLALAAGMFASVRNTQWVRSIVVAELLSAGCALVLMMPSNFNSRFVIAAVLFCLVLQKASSQLRVRWQESSTAPPQPKWTRWFADSVFWREVFKWDKSKTLRRNPIAWLQEYSWTARLTKWGWLMLVLVSELILVIVNIFDFATLPRGRLFFTWQIRIATVLAIGMAFSAAWSFRNERQSGALELLLVTPLQATQLIRGRIWGIWCHFFPALAILFFLWAVAPTWVPAGWTVWITYFAASFLTLPVIGLALSISRWPFFVAWLFTIVIALLIPLGVWQISRFFGISSLAPVFLVQAAAAAAAWFSLHRNLSNRSFALGND